MKLLEAQPEIAPGAPPEPPSEKPPEQDGADKGARTCKSCGAHFDHLDGTVFQKCEICNYNKL